MSIQAAPSDSRGLADEQSQRLRGYRLMLARAVWLALASISMAHIVTALPVEYARRSAICSAAPCEPVTLTPANVHELTALGLPLQFFATYVVAVELLFAVVALVVGGVIFWRRSNDRMALFTALMLVSFASLAFVGDAEVRRAPSSAPEVSFSLVWFLGNVTPIVFLFVFPDGRFVPRWSIAPALLLVALGMFFHLFPDSPIGSLLSSSIGTGVSLAIIAGALAAQIYRYRRVSGPLQRQQTKWVVYGICMAMVGSQVAQFLGPLLVAPHVLIVLALFTLLFLSLALIPLSVGMAILRHRLWDIDLLISRTLVYGALTTSVVGIYVVVVGYLGALFQTGDNLAIALVATGLVAVVFQPLRDRLQRGVNHLVYGARDEPYRALDDLGQRLEGTLDPDAVLPAIVDTVREALKLPYAAIILDQHGRAARAAAAGRLVEGTQSVELLYQGEAIGRLILGPRSVREGFSAADRRLIDLLARQAGVAAYAVRLTADLQRSREQLVVAREEERRRLRNDLHDGLGPQLASLTLKMQTARLRLAHDALAGTLLTDLIEGAQAAVADIRRVVYDLRPPTLDELGLLSALREGVAQLQAHPGIHISVDAPDQLPPLPAAVEVAAYRIAREALTNVVKHARASHCCLTIELDEHAGILRLEVQDDGAGIAPERSRGVGMISMRERAAELGGTLSAETLPDGGARVCALLPLKA